MKMPEEIYDSTLNNLVALAEKWQDDTPDCQIARGIIGSMRVALDAMSDVDPNEANYVIATLMVKHMTEMVDNIRTLDNLAKLREA